MDIQTRSWRLKEHALSELISKAITIFSGIYLLQDLFKHNMWQMSLKLDPSRCKRESILGSVLSKVSLIWNSPKLMPLRACCKTSFSESCWSGKLDQGVMYSENEETFISIIYLLNGDWILWDVVDFHSFQHTHWFS